MSLGAAFARLCDLRARHKRQLLSPHERHLYESLRNEFVRAFVAARRLNVGPGQSHCQALSVSFAYRLELAVAQGRVEKTLTLEVSPSGFVTLVGRALAAGQPVDFVLFVPSEPLRGRAHVVTCERHGSSSATFRVVVKLDALGDRDSARLQDIVLDAALAVLN
jgi:hypothetical protein